MVAYFADTDHADAAWAVYFLGGGRPKRLIPVRRLAQWAMEEANVPDWLFEESYEAVGDLAETVTLLLPDAVGGDDRPLSKWMDEVILPLARQPEADQQTAIVRAWRELGGSERFVFNKLITGGFRIGVSQQLVIRALSQASKVDEGVIAHRLSGTWPPTANSFAALFAEKTDDADISRPYPFYLAYAIEDELEELGAPDEWQAEWKWDGIRAQVIRRDGQTFVWSRGDELITERFPEIAAAAEFLPDGTVLDGEIMPWKDGAPLPFAQLQRRIGRKTLGAKILAEVPAVLVVYDLLEADGRDVRSERLDVRRARMERVIADARTATFTPSPVIALETWRDARAAHDRAREMNAE